MALRAIQLQSAGVFQRSGPVAALKTGPTPSGRAMLSSDWMAHWTIGAPSRRAVRKEPLHYNTPLQNEAWFTIQRHDRILRGTGSTIVNSSPASTPPNPPPTSAKSHTRDPPD